MYWAHCPPGFASKCLPPSWFPCWVPIIFSIDFQTSFFKYLHQVSFHIILASLFRAWILHRFSVAIWAQALKALFCLFHLCMRPARVKRPLGALWQRNWTASPKREARQTAISTWHDSNI